MTNESADRYAGKSHAELREIWRRDLPTMTQDEINKLGVLLTEAALREAPPLSEERRRRLRGTTFDDPGWAPRVVAHGFPRQPQDRVRVLREDGSQLVLLVRGAHRSRQSEFRYYQLQSPDNPARSWFLARDDAEASWGRGLEVGRESVEAVGWVDEPTTPPTEFVPPPSPPTIRVRVRPNRVDESGEEIRS